MFKKNKLLSIVLMSLFGINGAKSFASDMNCKKQIVSIEKNKPVQVKFNSGRAVRIGLNSMKVILGLTGIALPIANITYDIKKQLKKSDKKILKQAIKNYENACPNTKKLYDELNSAYNLARSIPNYNQSDPQFENVKKKIIDAENNWNAKTGVPDTEKLATISFGENKLDLMEAHKLLEKLEQESSDFGNTSRKIGLANNIYRIIEPIFR